MGAGLGNGDLFIMTAKQGPRDKPVILVFVRYYLPGYRAGGPVRSIANLVRALSGAYDFRIVCLNRDLGVGTPYADVVPGRWTPLDGAQVYYTDARATGFTLCRQILRDVRPDMIYLNSLLDREFSMLPFLVAGRGKKIPILLAPRGELSAGALGLKATRKRLFLALVGVSRHYAGVHWHAASASEQARIRSVFAPSDDRIFLASNLPKPVQDHIVHTGDKKPGALRIVIAARISPVKNTRAAIRMVGRLTGDIELDLWGLMESKEYWAECEREIAACPANVQVRYRGEFVHEQLQEVLCNYDVMLLPTLGENFGHAIIEALSSELPVIISDRTPWRDLEAAGVGADLPLEDEAAFAHHLARYAAMDAPALQSARDACRRYVETWFKKNADLDAYRAMFDAVIGARI